MSATIVVNCLHGKQAEVEPKHITRSGRLAVHAMVLSVGLSKTYFTITHISTGWSVCNSHGQPLKDVLKVAKELDKLDWNFSQVCQLPTDTLAGAHAVLDGKWHVSPGVSEDFKRTCFSEPTQ